MSFRGSGTQVALHSKWTSLTEPLELWVRLGARQTGPTDKGTERTRQGVEPCPRSGSNQGAHTISSVPFRFPFYREPCEATPCSSFRSNSFGRRVLKRALRFRFGTSAALASSRVRPVAPEPSGRRLAACHKFGAVSPVGLRGFPSLGD